MPLPNAERVAPPTGDLWSCAALLAFDESLDPARIEASVERLCAAQTLTQRVASRRLTDVCLHGDDDVEAVIDRAAAELAHAGGGAGTSIGWARVETPDAVDALLVVAHGLPYRGSDAAELADAFCRSYRLSAPSGDGASAARPRFNRRLPTPLAIDEELAYWERELAEKPPVLIELPAQRRVAAARSPIVPMSRLSRTLPDAVTDALRAYAHQHDCRVDAILFAAFAAVLGRYAGVEDIDVATFFAPRHEASHHVNGPLANTSLLRISLAGAPAFGALVDRARTALEIAQLHADVCLERLIHDQRIGGPEDGPALPLIAFDTRSDTALSAGVRLLHVGRRARTDAATFASLTLAYGLDADGVRLRWQFDPQRYEHATIERLAVALERSLTSVLAMPTTPISTISLMTADERGARIAAGQGETRPYERDASIGALWTLQAQRTPDAVALDDGATQLTYRAVDRRSNQLAHYLANAGVGAGSAVGVAFDRSVDMPIVLIAILKLGAAYVPLDLAYPAERLDLMIADAGITVIVSREAPPPELAFRGRTIRLDRERDAVDASVATPVTPGVDPESCAYIIYTSGSTGRPKGVMIPHRGVVRLVRGADYVDITSDDGFLQHAPLAFDASTFEIWAPLLNGARLGIPRPGLLAMDDLADAVERLRVTTLFLTTALFGRLVESGHPSFGRLRHVLTGGEVASPAHMRRFIASYPTCRLTAVYGPTENTTFSTWHDLPTDDAIGTNVPIGRPIANSTAYIVDAAGEPTPVGVPGELWVGGDGVATKYLNRPELSLERFVDDRLVPSSGARVYKTGDRARWREDDVIEFLGRTDDQVKIRGFRIELGEIESLLQAYNGVRDAAVVAALAGTDKALFAFIVPERGAPLTEMLLRDYLSSKLPRYMLPHRIALVDALPEHASGKVDRVALARSASDAPERPTMPQPPAVASIPLRPTKKPNAAGRELQQTIGAIWRDILSLDTQPGLDINFFDAGGDSLRLLTVHTHLRAQLGMDIQIMDLFEHTTVRKLAAHLAETAAK